LDFSAGVTARASSEPAVEAASLEAAGLHLEIEQSLQAIRILPGRDFIGLFISVDGEGGLPLLQQLLRFGDGRLEFGVGLVVCGFLSAKRGNQRETRAEKRGRQNPGTHRQAPER
jgi:hypothetical protein